MLRMRDDDVALHRQPVQVVRRVDAWLGIPLVRGGAQAVCIEDKHLSGRRQACAPTACVNCCMRMMVHMWHVVYQVDARLGEVCG